MALHNKYANFRTGGVPLTYRPSFTDHGDEYASLYAGERLIAADVLRGDAQAICEFFNSGIRAALEAAAPAPGVPAAPPERRDP